MFMSRAEKDRNTIFYFKAAATIIFITINNQSLIDMLAY